MVRQDLSAGEWQLIIRDVRYSDAGQYECQINTSPVLSHTIKLAVVGEHLSTQPLDTPWYHHLSIFPPLHFSRRVESAYSISLIIYFSQNVRCNLKYSNKTINGSEFHNIISLTKIFKEQSKNRNEHKFFE